MKKSSYSPIPLFDTLKQMEVDVVNLPTELTAQLPENATSDHRLAIDFLKSYRGSQATFNAYRREIERLLHWAWGIAHKNLQQVKRADIEAFVYFCQRPPENWIGTAQKNRFITQEGRRIANPEWHPFVSKTSKKDHREGKTADIKNYALSQSGVQAIFSILSSFFNFLIVEDHIPANPVAQIRQKSKFLRKQQHQAPIRRLTELQWAYVIETAEIMAKENPEQHERTLFIMAALFGMYLRISELAASDRWIPLMGHFTRDHDANWWFTTVGKGNKERNISVSDAMLAALKRYRLSMHLPALPSLGESTPLIPKLQGSGPVRETRHIRRLVQQCFDATILRLQHDGFTQEADQLVNATVHWLRHTGISEDVKLRPREHVRDDAGHGSSAITDRYIDVELRARHLSAKKKIIKPED